ncbi:MAG: sulfur carrier protein ThiS [Paludibacteraceae bacterium]|nr:sulfur carrier protein ThiS [Paludibacteraceae bacterium]
MANIIVNGKNQEVTLPLTLVDLIKLNNILQPDMVSIQVNEEFVERSEFETFSLKEGDQVDFLYFMGGGAF